MSVQRHTLASARYHSQGRAYRSHSRSDWDNRMREISRMPMASNDPVVWRDAIWTGVFVTIGIGVLIFGAAVLS